MIQCHDERTKEEMETIKSSRWDSAAMYLSEAHLKLNDVEASYDREAYDFLLSQGVDEAVSKHVAHLWVRDSGLLLKDMIDQTLRRVTATSR